MFPLKNRQLIRGCQDHKDAGLGCGGDYVAVYDDLFAPFDGIVKTWWGEQGGNWIQLLRPNGHKIEFAHLHRIYKTGEVKEGDKIARTGNTGRITTGPHKHIQIKYKNGNRVDPETYNWEVEMKPTNEQIKMAFYLVFRREGGEAYFGHDWDFILGEWGKSDEWNEYTPVFQAVKGVENWARQP